MIPAHRRRHPRARLSQNIDGHAVIHPESEDDKSREDNATSSLASEEYLPKPRDIYHVRALLRTLKLPTELVLSILSFADYAPKLRTHRDENIRYAASSGANSVIAGLYLTSPSIPTPNSAKGEKFKIRYVRFTITSADQGWGGESGCQGTYRGSWTWFDTAILRPRQDFPAEDRFKEPLETTVPRQPQAKLQTPEEAGTQFTELGWEFVPRDHVAGERDQGVACWTVQRNVTAASQFKTHVVEWRADEEEHEEDMDQDGKGDGKGFMEKLRVGDVVALWPRAQYPGWNNNVKEAQIEIGYDV